MKTTLLVAFILLTHAIVSSQTILWEQNRFDGNNILFYTGGFPRVSSEFADIDADGDYDCFVGTSDGNIALFENAGDSISPSWKQVTQQYLDIDLNTIDRLKVRLIDIDSDSDLDLFIGGALSNSLLFYKNVGTIFNAEWELVPGFFDEIEAEEDLKFCFPAFVDIDNDDDYDLIYGNRKGYDVFYENQGDKYSCNFVKQSSDYFGLSSIKNSHNIEFADIDDDSDLDALVGTHYTLTLIKNVGTAESAEWQVDTSNYLGINKYNCGTYFSPSVTDINSDNILDLLVGTDNGTFWQYDTISGRWIRYDELYFDEGSFLNPEFADLDGDSKVELYLPIYDGYHDTSYIQSYNNVGSIQSIIWEEAPVKIPVDFPYPVNRITFADVDNDDDLDLIVAFTNLSQDILLFRNIGNRSTPNFDVEPEAIAQFREDQLINFYPILVDYDNDSDLDLIVSAQDGTMNSYPWVDFFENTGDPISYNWEFSFSDVLGYGSILCVDDDNDKDLDLLFGYSNRVSLIQNRGNENEPSYQSNHTKIIELTSQIISGITSTDLNNDGRGDLLIGTHKGGLLRYDDKGFIEKVDDHLEETVRIFPNPTQCDVFICGLDYNKSEYQFLIFDYLGKQARQLRLTNNHISLSLLNSGLYFYRILHGDNVISTGKIVITE